jgi:hypothetical protein
MFGRKAMEWYQRKEHEVATAQSALLGRHEPGLGPTLQDGGDLLVSPAAMCSPEQYERIIEVLFRPEAAA